MGEGRRTIRLWPLSVVLALLAGLLIATAACGDEGEPQPRRTGVPVTSATAQPSPGAHTPSPSAVGGEPSATPAAATSTPAGTVAPPTAVTATPTEPVATPTATVIVPATLGFGYDMLAMLNSYDTIRKIMGTGTTFVPGHDPDFFNMFPKVADGAVRVD